MAVVMCGVNSYLTLKVGVIEEGFVVTFLLFFIGVQILRLFARQGVITEAEATIVGTMGSAGGSLAFIANVFAALKMAGHDLTWWQMSVFAILVSLGGLLMAVPFRLLYIVKEPLPWPTGKVAESSIKAVLSGMDSIQPKVLAVGATVAFAYIFGIGLGWFPEMTMLPLGLGSLGVGLAWSPFILGAGYLIGLRVGWGFGVGAIILALMAPHLDMAPHKYVWPGVMALLTCGLTGLLLKWKTIKSAMTSLSPHGLLEVSEEDKVFSSRALKWLVIIVFIVTVVGLKVAFHINILVSSCGLVVAYTILNAIATRATGETAFNPVRVMGVILMALFAVLGLNDSWSTLIGAGIAAAGIGATSLLVQDNYVGRAFNVPAKQQLLSQAVVLPLTACVCAWVFILADNTYGVGSEKLPAAVAMLWSSVAKIFAGETQLPAFAKEAMAIGAVSGVVLALLDEVAGRKIKSARSTGKSSLWRFMPHSLGITLGLLLPIPYDLAFFVGAVVLCWLMPKFKVSDEALTGVAAAGIVGEGTSNLVVAILTAFGVLGGSQ
jgi:uncharacterized oligopeptide transporter (OPT) family protein